MLAHQMAAAHTMAMEQQAEARQLMQRFKRTGYVHQHLSVEAGRCMNASARMMDTFQHGLLTIQKLRSGGQQTVVVQHVNVGDGGRAMVAGEVKVRGKRPRRGRRWRGKPKSEQQPHTRGDPEQEPGPGKRLPSMWRTNPERGPVPGHADGERTMQMHGVASPGAPRGEGNGMFRHGLRSIDAIERRRKMTAELRAIRRSLQELART